MRFVRMALIALLVLNPHCAAQAQDTGAPVVPQLPALRTEMAVPVQKEPAAATLDRTKGQMWRRATVTLLGSMCLACLMKLERDISEIPGVAYIKISRPSANAAHDDVAAKAAGDKSPEAGKDIARTVSASIIFDAQSVKFDRLLAYMKREKYKASDVQEVDYN